MDRPLAQQIAQTFSKAISSIFEQPDTGIQGLPLLYSLDLSQLEQWNGQQWEPHADLLHDLVRVKMVQQPDAKAVAPWDGERTYRELDRLAERLAGFLQSLVLKPEAKVGLSGDKSLWAVVSQLTVLKAGGAVVSLSITSPGEQLKCIVEDIAADILLVSGTQASRLRGFAQHVITVDAVLLSSLPEIAFVQSSVLPCNPIIYTSGSTGKPKGVILEHTTLSSMIKTYAPVYGIAQDTQVLKFSSCTFDFSIYGTFTTLWAGGCVCIPSEHGLLNNLVDAMRDLRVNSAALTSTVASLLPPSQLPLLKTLVLLSEPARPTVIEEWASHSTVLNAYGPAESCVTTVGPFENIEDASKVATRWAVMSGLWIRITMPSSIPLEFLESF